MWYGASPATVKTDGGPLARRVLDAAPWDAVAVDVIRTRLEPGWFAVSPGERALCDGRWQATGPRDPVVLATRADHPLLSLDGRALPADGVPRAVPASSLARGLPWPAGDAGEATVVMARRAAPGEVLDRRRRSGRVFRPRPGVSVDTLPDWAADRPLRFDSKYQPLGPLEGFVDAPFAVIAEEPIFAASHPTWIAEHGGPIARAFVAALPDDWRTPDADVIVNAKINEFEPGWSSCLVGYHIDGTSRINKRSDGTPDLLNPGKGIEQIACNVGPAGQTGFLLGPVALPITPEGADGRGVWQRILRDAMADGSMKAVQAPVGERVAFGFGDFHTCRPARRPGWRYFIKAMRGRGDAPKNMLRESTGISWPLEAEAWPDAPLGLFPATLPTHT